MLRRELLKYFAAGTIIAPVGGPIVKAELIEVPKVRPIETPKILRPVDLSQVESATVTLKMRDGTERALSLTDLITRGGDSMVTAGKVTVTVRISEELDSSPVAVLNSIVMHAKGEFL